MNGQFRNPNFPETSPQGTDQVRLRGYIGEVVGEDGQPAEQIEFVAPLVELAPGDTFRLTLHNDLPALEAMELPGVDADGNPLTCLDDAADHNQPHCSHFNLTNMHTHGLWVSPLGNSDNVLLTINPGVPFTYDMSTTSHLITRPAPSGTTRTGTARRGRNSRAAWRVR